MSTFLTDHAVAPSSSGLTAENPYCIRGAVDGELVARQGAMVAYRGDLALNVRSQGVKKLLKRAVTGEGLPLMTVAGKGDVWLADLAKNVFVLEIADGNELTVSGKSVLCFDASLDYDIRMLKGSGMSGGGLFNCHFSGTGSLAVSSDGQPMVIPVTPDSPVSVDTDAVIGWSASLDASVHRSQSLKSVLKGGSGELYQLRLAGEGSVIVQPSEGPLKPDGGGGGGIGDAVGDILGG